MRWLAASNYYEDGIQRDFSRPYKEGVTQAEGLEYIIELLKNGEFVAKCEDTSSKYITTQPGSGVTASDGPDTTQRFSLCPRPSPLPVSRNSLKVFRRSSLVSRKSGARMGLNLPGLHYREMPRRENYGTDLSVPFLI